MKVFVDANILVSDMNKEYPLFPHAARLLSWISDNGHYLYTTSLYLAIAFYFAEKKHGSKKAKEKIALLTSRFKIAECNETEVRQAIEDKKIKDFEDGLQYYAAKNALSDCIMTEDTGDFYFARSYVYSTSDFLMKYANKGYKKTGHQ